MDNTLLRFRSGGLDKCTMAATLSNFDNTTITIQSGGSAKLSINSLGADLMIMWKCLKVY